MNFDRVIERRGTNCYKWDTKPDISDTNVPDDLISMWVADMDFVVADEILDALFKRLKHGVFGYTFPGNEYFDSIINWWKERYGVRLKREWIIPLTGVIPGMALAIEKFSSKGSEVIIQPPVYWPFRNVIELNDRIVVENELLENSGEYTMDFDDLDEKAKDSKIMVLCSPHNPVGRVWSDGELEELSKVAKRRELLVISDEIHSDFSFSKKFISAISIDGLRDRAIVLASPNKTFNIPGIRNGYAIIPNEDIREKFEKAVMAHNMKPNIFSIVATQAAYTNGKEWLENVREYILENFNLVQEKLDGCCKIKMKIPEGTFLAWIDFRETGLEDPYIEILKKGVWLQDGKVFGKSGKGFLRMNVATPREILLEALRRIREGLK